MLLNGSWISLGDGAAHPVCHILWGVSASIENALEQSAGQGSRKSIVLGFQQLFFCSSCIPFFIDSTYTI